MNTSTTELVLLFLHNQSPERVCIQGEKVVAVTRLISTSIRSYGFSRMLLEMYDHECVDRINLLFIRDAAQN